VVSAIDTSIASLRVIFVVFPSAATGGYLVPYVRDFVHAARDVVVGGKWRFSH
jgi:hypothetical protein